MAFGQSSGPAASGRQVQELLELLQGAGHSDFRDARGPMGFTQRQATGKFTASEAAAFIEQLQDDEHRRDLDGDPASIERGDAAVAAPPADRALRSISDGRLADELRRRGWTVVAP